MSISHRKPDANPEIRLSDPSSSSGEGVRGGDIRHIATIRGHRILSTPEALQIPNTREGKALLTLLGLTPPPLQAARANVRRDPLYRQHLDMLAQIIVALQHDIQNPADTQAVTEELMSRGVFRPALAELARDPWVTVDRIRRHWDSFQGRELRNRSGLLIKLLRDHVEPPAPGARFASWMKDGE